MCVLGIPEISWSDIPGERPYYSPGEIAASLTSLAHATTEREASSASGPLFSSGLVHNHSGAVHPAAVVAAPILMDIVELAHPEAVQAALLLLHYALDFEPIPGYAQIATEDGPDLPLCCAIGRQLQVRRSTLADRGLIGKRLLAKADAHWRFRVVELSNGDDEALLALGELDGVMPSGVLPADVRIAGGGAIRGRVRVRLEYPSSGAGGEACAVIFGEVRERLDDGMVLFPAGHEGEADAQ